MSIAARVLQAINDELPEHERSIAGAAGGTVSVVVKLDAAGCPKRIAVRTEVEREIERRRPVSMAI